MVFMESMHAQKTKPFLYFSLCNYVYIHFQPCWRLKKLKSLHLNLIFTPIWSFNLVSSEVRREREEESTVSARPLAHLSNFLSISSAKLFYIRNQVKNNKKYFVKSHQRRVAINEKVHFNEVHTIQYLHSTEMLLFMNWTGCLWHSKLLSLPFLSRWADSLGRFKLQKILLVFSLYLAKLLWKHQSCKSTKVKWTKKAI